MLRIIQIISVLLLSTLSPLTFAQMDDCARPDAIDFTMDGNSASEEEFAAARAEIQNYNDAATIYFQCLDQVIANTPQEEQQPIIDVYNDMDMEVQATVNAFNRQARVYTARMSSIESADDCVRPEAIDIGVDGSTATEEEMLGARTMVQNYHQAANTYLECLQLAAQVVSPEEQDNLVELYNGMTAEMQEIIVNDFNVQIRAYQARMSDAAEEAQ
jgi:hypothetical protein